MKIFLRNIQKKNTMNYLAAFLFPSAVLLICFYFKKIFPFGDSIVYTWDLSGQYSSFFVLLHNILIGKCDWTYSLFGGLGDSLFGLIAYYLSSPFNIILVFFNAQTMPLGVTLLYFVKTSCMGLFMYIYLYKKNPSFFAILFSTAYSLCSYCITYQSNIMWLDALIFLPLVILGLEQLIESQKILLYSLALGLTIIANYYTGYMVCLFCVVYFLAYFLFKTQKSTFKNRLQILGRFTLGSLLGGGLSAFLLLPAVNELSKCSDRAHVGIEALFNTTRIYMQTRLLPLFLSCAYDDSHRWDMKGFPLIYCGLIAIIGLTAFFFAKQITLREKLFGIFLISSIFISFNHMNLFFIWHGMYTPFGAPWRFAFVGVFAILLIAYKGFSVMLASDNFKLLLCTTILVILYFVYIFLRCTAYRSILGFNICIAGILLFSIFLFRKNRKFYSISMFLGLAIMCIELCANTLYIWNQGFTFDSYSEYQQYLSEMQQLIPKHPENSFYRSMTTGTGKRSINDGYLLSLNSTNAYTSTSKTAPHDVFSTLGIRSENMELDYNGRSTALSNALLGLRYLYGSNISAENYTCIDSSASDISLYENANVLPLAFPVNSSAAGISVPNENDNLFGLQNALFLALSDNILLPYQAEQNTIDISSYPSGEISYIGNSLYTDGDSIYRENLELISNTILDVSASTLSVDANHHADISACIQNNNSASYVCFAIPYDQNWRAKVNGEPSEIIKGMGSFMLVPIEQGVSEINITYRSTALTLGGIISILSFIILLYMNVLPDAKSKFYHKMK